MTDPTSMPLLHVVEGVADVRVDGDHSYASEHGPLGFEIYRPAGTTAPYPAVIFVNGFPDPGVVAMCGKPLKAWRSYQDWARSVAARGIAGITYVNQRASDVIALVRHVRDNAAALGIDPARIGIWACSGHGPNALALIAREPLACAALVYPYTMDLDGATDVATAFSHMHLPVPDVAFDALPRELPMLVVRAGRDATSGLDAALQRFIAAGRAAGLAMRVVEHAEAPHAFDLVDDSPRTHEVVEEILGFLHTQLIS